MKNQRLSTGAARRLTSVVALVGFGFVLGASQHDSSIVNADVRKTPPRQSFQAGSERSEVYLKEISATLKRIETRLDQISLKADSLPSR